MRCVCPSCVGTLFALCCFLFLFSAKASALQNTTQSQSRSFFASQPGVTAAPLANSLTLHQVNFSEGQKAFSVVNPSFMNQVLTGAWSSPTQIRLRPNGNWGGGALWYNTSFHFSDKPMNGLITEGLEFSLDFYFSGSMGRNGGVAFAMQNVGAKALGEGGPGLSVVGIPNSMALSCSLYIDRCVVAQLGAALDVSSPNSFPMTPYLNQRNRLNFRVNLSTEVVNVFVGNDLRNISLVVPVAAGSARDVFLSQPVYFGVALGGKNCILCGSSPDVRLYSWNITTFYAQPSELINRFPLNILLGEKRGVAHQSLDMTQKNSQLVAIEDVWKNPINQARANMARDAISLHVKGSRDIYDSFAFVNQTTPGLTGEHSFEITFAYTMLSGGGRGGFAFVIQTDSPSFGNGTGGTCCEDLGFANPELAKRTNGIALAFSIYTNEVGLFVGLKNSLRSGGWETHKVANVSLNGLWGAANSLITVHFTYLAKLHLVTVSMRKSQGGPLTTLRAVVNLEKELDVYGKYSRSNSSARRFHALETSSSGNSLFPELFPILYPAYLGFTFSGPTKIASGDGPSVQIFRSIETYVERPKTLTASLLPTRTVTHPLTVSSSISLSTSLSQSTSRSHTPPRTRTPSRLTPAPTEPLPPENTTTPPPTTIKPKEIIRVVAARFAGPVTVGADAVGAANTLAAATLADSLETMDAQAVAVYNLKCVLQQGTDSRRTITPINVAPGTPHGWLIGNALLVVIAAVLNLCYAFAIWVLSAAKAHRSQNGTSSAKKPENRDKSEKRRKKHKKDQNEDLPIHSDSKVKIDSESSNSPPMTWEKARQKGKFPEWIWKMWNAMYQGLAFETFTLMMLSSKEGGAVAMIILGFLFLACFILYGTFVFHQSNLGQQLEYTLFPEELLNQIKKWRVEVGSPYRWGPRTTKETHRTFFASCSGVGKLRRYFSMWPCWRALLTALTCSLFDLSCKSSGAILGAIGLVTAIICFLGQPFHIKAQNGSVTIISLFGAIILAHDILGISKELIPVLTLVLNVMTTCQLILLQLIKFFSQSKIEKKFTEFQKQEKLKKEKEIGDKRKDGSLAREKLIDQQNRRLQLLLEEKNDDEDADEKASGRKSANRQAEYLRTNVLNCDTYSYWAGNRHTADSRAREDDDNPRGEASLLTKEEDQRRQPMFVNASATSIENDPEFEVLRLGLLKKEKDEEQLMREKLMALAKKVEKRSKKSSKKHAEEEAGGYTRLTLANLASLQNPLLQGKEPTTS